MSHTRHETATRRASRLHRATRPVWASCMLLALAVQGHAAESFEGFLEPFRTLQIAAPEPGVVVEMLVREGDVVEQGQPLARLDDDLLLAQLAIAELQMKSTGQLQAVLAELTIHEQRWKKLTELESKGLAYPDEVARARADKEAAEGRVLAERENLRLLERQYEKLQLQVAKRVIRSPVKGSVAAVLKHAGEFVSPADPVVAKVVVLDPLRATFFLPRASTENLTEGESVSLKLAEPGELLMGKVEHVSPLTDAESGAVTVKVLLDNSQRKLFSGERCILELK